MSRLWAVNPVYLSCIPSIIFPYHVQCPYLRGLGQQRGLLSVNRQFVPSFSGQSPILFVPLKKRAPIQFKFDCPSNAQLQVLPEVLQQQTRVDNPNAVNRKEIVRSVAGSSTLFCILFRLLCPCRVLSLARSYCFQLMGMSLQWIKVGAYRVRQVLNVLWFASQVWLTGN